MAAILRRPIGRSKALVVKSLSQGFARTAQGAGFRTNKGFRALRRSTCRYRLPRIRGGLLEARSCPWSCVTLAMWTTSCVRSILRWRAGWRNWNTSGRMHFARSENPQIQLASSISDRTPLSSPALCGAPTRNAWCTNRMAGSGTGHDCQHHAYNIAGWIPACARMTMASVAPRALNENGPPKRPV